jgi:hypothetical protein
MKGTTMKNTLKKTAAWIKKNPELAVVYTIYGAMIGGTVWICVEAAKAESQYIDEYNTEVARKNAAVQDAYASGSLPFLLADGSLLNVPKETNFSVVI